MEFSLKPISFFGKPRVIICQNENGPCPLLAIANVLILTDKITISTDISIMSLAELTQIVANAILEKIGQSSLPEHIKLVESVLNILPKLARGLDLNVIFNGVNKFEFTEEISVFDALDIQLLHGWICDPNDAVTAAVVGNLSYNHVIFRLVEYKSLSSKTPSLHTTQHADNTSNNQTTEGHLAADTTVHAPQGEKQLQHDGAVIEKFLADTAGQFTYPGMLALYSSMQDRQFAVFFRNNHFSTLFFFNGQLFILITDLGYLHEPSVVWEILDGIDGNSEFYNDQFEPLSSAQSPGFALRHTQEFETAAQHTASAPAAPGVEGQVIDTVLSPFLNMSSQSSETAASSSSASPTRTAGSVSVSAGGIICAPPKPKVNVSKSTDGPTVAVVGPRSVTDSSKAAVAAPSENDEHGLDLMNSAVLINPHEIPPPTTSTAETSSVPAPVSFGETVQEEGISGMDDSYELVEHHVVKLGEHDTDAAAHGCGVGGGGVDSVGRTEMEASETKEDHDTFTVAATVTGPVPVSGGTHPIYPASENTTSAGTAQESAESPIDADLLFAMQLQEEEDKLAAQQQQQQQQQTHHHAARGNHTQSTASASYNSTSNGQNALLSQEEQDREHALMLHYQDIQEAEQSRAARAAHSSTQAAHAAHGPPPTATGARNAGRRRTSGSGGNCVIS